MNKVQLLLTGQLKMSEFIVMLKSDSDLQHDVVSLVPQDAVNNQNHNFWRKISYDALRKYNFNLLNFLFGMHRFDESIADNLDLFGSIYAAYSFFDSDLVCTKEYAEAFDLYLDVVKDCFDGPEVNHLVEKIINEALLLKGKGKRKQFGKQLIASQFHATDKKAPRWIQGPEWPMGANSPMEFLSQNRHGEVVQYQFRDVDTNMIRIVEQFY